MNVRLKKALLIIFIIVAFLGLLYFVLYRKGALPWQFKDKTIDGIYIGMDFAAVTNTNTEKGQVKHCGKNIFEDDQVSELPGSPVYVQIYTDYEYLGYTGDMGYWYDSDFNLIYSTFQPYAPDTSQAAIVAITDVFISRYPDQNVPNIKIPDLTDKGTVHLWTINESKLHPASNQYIWIDWENNEIIFILTPKDVTLSADIVIAARTMEERKENDF